MNSDVAIQLDGVGKRYSKLEEQAMLLRSVIPLWRPARTELWALRNVNLTVQRGETLGIMGHNGAGKSTLLRLVAGVSQPTRGAVLVRGRVAPLIGVGVGFHPEMSGRENVYVNGMLLGLRRRDVDARFDEIVAFAGLEDFIDTPVKFYSSGMFMRLGFAVAVFADPQILLVDEVLAVGDIAFQLKCFDRMREIQSRGTTIVVVSHSTHAIRLLCPRTLLISGGDVVFDGATPEAISRHLQLLSGHVGAPGRDGSVPAVEVLERGLIGPHGPTLHLPRDELVTFTARVRFNQDIERAQAQFQIFADTGVFVYGRRTLTGFNRSFRQGDVVSITVPFQQRLGGNTYRLVLNILDGNDDPLYLDSDGLLVYVAGRPGAAGLVDVDASIVMDGQEVTDELTLLLGADPATNRRGLQ